jgi:hypothetical protein
MMALARSLERNYWTVSLALVLALGVLLVLSPAEATLGSVVKVVYLHGAMERISTYAYLLAAAGGVLELVTRQAALVRWTQSLSETAIAFWLGQIIISLPAQLLAWGGLMWDEPRVVGAFWILVLTALVYVVARWIAEPAWLAFAAVANGVIVLIVLRGGINLLHPLNPIIASESVSIKLFYFAIVVVMGALALQLAYYRAASRGSALGG